MGGGETQPRHPRDGPPGRGRASVLHRRRRQDLARGPRRSVPPDRSGRLPLAQDEQGLEAADLRGSGDGGGRRVLLAQRGRPDPLLRGRDLLRPARDLRDDGGARADRHDPADPARGGASNRPRRPRRARLRTARLRDRPRQRDRGGRPAARTRARAGGGDGRQAGGGDPGNGPGDLESLDVGRTAALERGLSYTQLGNPLGMADVDRETQQRPKPVIR